MEPKISIPKPCHEDWSEMLPEEQGRHCQACSRIVIDFSSWSNDQILGYIANRSGERVCGRFDVNQVQQTPVETHTAWVKHIGNSGMSFMRKVAAVIVLCFGLLQGNEAAAQEVMGKIAPVRQHQITGEVAAPDTAKQQVPVPADTIKTRPQIMGIIALPQPKDKPVPKDKQQKKAHKEAGRKQ